MPDQDYAFDEDDEVPIAEVEAPIPGDEVPIPDDEEWV